MEPSSRIERLTAAGDRAGREALGALERLQGAIEDASPGTGEGGVEGRPLGREELIAAGLVDHLTRWIEATVASTERITSSCERARRFADLPPLPDAEPPGQPAMAVRREPPGEEGGAPSAAGPAPPEGVRLLIVQMAASGSDRGEIARRLEQDFGVRDASGAVEVVLS